MAALVVFVFALALRAKLSLYDPPHPGSINPAAAKLWVSGEKLKTMPGTLPVLWLAPLLFSVFPVRRVLGLAPERPLAPRHLDRLELFRFLRPPPAF
ncbi:MAG TPA: hypothetical protein VN810_00720 [Terriglobales bacterium]|nr:hypothetical protein [Terriglobales bacterium]